MPVFNGERFLREAVESILRQTYGDFEFVIVDDGSTDGTRDILQTYECKDRRVRIHRQPRNLGVTSALNQGCRLASGSFIARMDADDISVTTRLDQQIAYL